MSSKLWTLGIATALALACATAAAQPEPRDHREHDRDDRRVPPPGMGPREAPPPPQAENPGAKAGFEWVTGRWDWKGGKWQWMAGHWEREHAGKHWHPGRWEHRGDAWAYVEGEWGEGGAPTAVVVVGPNAPPPPPQAENPGAKAGFEWVPGRWDWHDGKYQWLAGHWEREHAGQHWHPGRWEQQGGNWAFVEGSWGAGEAPPMPPMPPPGAMLPPQGMEHHREWKLERPTVSSYWPTLGKFGRLVTIRGRNFPPDTRVMWGDQPVPGARVLPDLISFNVPQGAPSATILLDVGHGHNLIVGNFRTNAGDENPENELRKEEERRRKEAEAAWAEQQKALAKDRAAREAAWHQREEEMERTREERRERREAELRAKWDAAFLGDPDTQSELTLHAQRVAELQRALDIAQVSENGKLVVRIQVAQGRENDRHDQRMAALKTAFATKGPNP